MWLGGERDRYDNMAKDGDTRSSARHGDVAQTPGCPHAGSGCRNKKSCHKQNRYQYNRWEAGGPKAALRRESLGRGHHRCTLFRGGNGGAADTEVWPSQSWSIFYHLHLPFSPTGQAARKKHYISCPDRPPSLDNLAITDRTRKQLMPQVNPAGFFLNGVRFGKI
jgi:hypothetical protein